MKSELHPGIAAVIIVILLIVVGVFIYRASNGGGSKAPGAVGNPGPFAPGGAANAKAEPKKP